MRKILLPFLLVLLTVSGVYAQDDYPAARSQSMRFGAYIAPNLSWMHPTAGKSDDGRYVVESNGSKIGYSWGLLAEYFFAENYALATGFQLNTTGGKLITRNVGDTTLPHNVLATDFDYNVQYLEIPFGLKLRSDELGSGGIRVFGQIGLTLGINIGKKATYTVEYRDDDNIRRVLTGEREKLVGSLTMAPAMLQLNVGAGVETPLSGKMALYTGLFFNNGFLPDATNPEKFGLGYAGIFSDGKIRLNNLALRVGLLF
jgi:hypothetical protein